MPANYLPNLKYLPEPLSSITAKTMLNDGVSLGTFLINTNLDHITDLNERKILQEICCLMLNCYIL